MRRSVLVTGAESGIGACAVPRLAGLGFHVVATARSEQGADALEELARAPGLEIEVAVLDVTDEDARVRVVGGRDLFGLVNNAGYFNAGTIEDVPLDDARRQLETMVLAPMRLAQLAIPSMRANGEGRIVNMSSALTLASGPLAGWYQASKQALEAASDALRLEVAQEGIEVVQIRPGAIATPIWDKMSADLRVRRAASAYPRAYDRAAALVESLRGHMHGVDEVADVLVHALTSGRPKPIYRMGRDASLLARVNTVLPLTVKDRLVRAAMKT